MAHYPSPYCPSEPHQLRYFPGRPHAKIGPSRSRPTPPPCRDSALIGIVLATALARPRSTGRRVVGCSCRQERIETNGPTKSRSLLRRRMHTGRRSANIRRESQVFFNALRATRLHRLQESGVNCHQMFHNTLTTLRLLYGIARVAIRIPSSGICNSPAVQRFTLHNFNPPWKSSTVQPGKSVPCFT